ncbi:MAG: PolC-type DNA polymerase III [Mycoplasmataceae bacterium]|nr:PolC-type DNA polymerase III [Mycoplasmataceae bacterium]
MKKLCKEIEYKPGNEFVDSSISKATLVDNIFVLDFEIREILPFEKMIVFLDHLNNNFKYKAKPSFEALHVEYDKENIIGYIGMIVDKFLGKPQLSKEILSCNIKVKENLVTIMTEDIIHEQRISSIKIDMQRVLRKFGFSNIKLSIKFDDNNTHILDNELKNKIILASKVMERTSEAKQDTQSIQYRPRGFQKIEISELATTDFTKVLTTGLIFKKEIKTTKTDFVICTLSITDYKDAVYVKMFGKTLEEKTDFDRYKEGTYVEVAGNYAIDPFSTQPTITLNKSPRIVKNASLNRDDDEPIKRVELSARTKMSTMDGVVSAKLLFERAEKWGHKAITIVDKDSLQSFPDFFYASKNSTVKPIYGVTLSTINKNNGTIYWPKDNNLENDTYVVFDLETTGLSPEYNEIIEFGAALVKGGQIIETKQFFIKPKGDVPEFTTKLTGITNDMVKNSPSEEESIIAIRDYLLKGTIVAHNANFDITFVNAKLAQYGHEAIEVPTIDSLATARLVLPEQKRFALRFVSKKYGVIYETEVAHRADYDANVLARVWMKMIYDLKELGINSQQELTNHYSDSLNNKKFTKEISLLAKNQKGLKELFKFTSTGLTVNFEKHPKIFVEDLEKRVDVLLGSGSLGSRLVERMFFGSKAQVIEEIKKYDYIEVQPPKNFIHFINRGMKKEDVEDMISFVINEAKKANKIVVASGDVKYLDELDKIYHEVYISAKGLGGSRHKLFSYNEENPKYPIFNFLTTKEMREEFAFLSDVKLIEEIVVTNTNKIADMIEDIEVIKKDLYTPGFDDVDNKVNNFVYKTAREIYGDNLPKIVEDRIERELAPIKKYGFSVIYWISHILVSKSLQDGFLVGSRGSVGSSIVATFLNITEVNPLVPHYVCPKCKNSEFPESAAALNSGFDLEDKLCPKCNIKYMKNGHNIPFETFLGFEADKVPDIDLNFSGEYQAIIHNEVKKIFGDKHAFRAGTISTVAEKTAFGYVKAWAEGRGKEISRPFTEFIAKGVAGTKRTSGQHPGGIIIIPSEFDVEDFTPINFPANDGNAAWKTTHFDFHAIHDNVLKLDLLGHDDPTAIRMLEKLTGIDARKDIPFSDPRIVSLFSSTKELGIEPKQISGEPTGAMGIPEFGTKFVRGMLKNATVKSFGDLISLSGLSHGTNVWTNNAEDLIKNQNLELNDVISCRDDIMVDLINKGVDPLLSFEIMEKVRKGKGITVEQEKILRENNVEDWYIGSLKKIEYMFPKAHATAYVMMAWRIAFFKLYHPMAYYATYFSTRSDVFDIHTVISSTAKIEEKLKDFISRRYKYGSEKTTNKEESLIPVFELVLEAKARGIKFSPISLDKSKAEDWVLDNENMMLIPPFTSLDGLGLAVAKSVIVAREESEFSSVEDFKKRTQINKTQLEKLEEMKVFGDMSKTNQISLFNI